MPLIPMPTPMIAVISGMPAATREPKVITSTTRATAMPISSATGAVVSSVSASPPMATRSPAASRAASASSSAAWSAAVELDGGLLS